MLLQLIRWPVGCSCSCLSSFGRSCRGFGVRALGRNRKDAARILQLGEGGIPVVGPGVHVKSWNLSLRLRWTGSMVAALYLMTSFDWDA